MPPRRTPFLALVALLLIACASPAPTVPAPGSSSPEPLDRIPVSDTVQRDGVNITLQIDAGRVTAGDRIRLIATVTNAEPGIVFWQGGGCDLQDDLRLEGPEPQVAPVGDPPQGNDPASITGLIRWAALVGGGGMGGFVPPNLPPGAEFACDASLAINELRSGETERVEAIWNGRSGDGIPALAGPYEVSIAFPFLARQAAPPFEGDPIADAKPIETGVPFEVVGAPWAGVTAAQAVDAALADQRIQTWIGGIQRTAVGGARIRLVDGAMWRFEVDVAGPGNDTLGVVVADVDPGSGRVVRVEIPTAA